MLLLALAACSVGESAPGELLVPLPPRDGGGAAVLHISPEMYEPDEEPEPTAPELTPEARELVATWSEPRRDRRDGIDTWTWQGADEVWELRLRGTPWLSDDDSRLLTVPAGEGLRLVRSGPDGETVVHAAMEGSGPVQLLGSIDGRPAGADELRALLAGLLPPIAAHTGLAADYRIEQAVQRHGLRRALQEISRLTSSFARLHGYETLLGELDEPSPSNVARLLRHAAVNLPADGDMRELLLEVADLSLDQRSLVTPALEAAATIEDDEALCDVLSNLLDRSDDPTDATVAKVLRIATAGVERDAPLASLLVDAAFCGLDGRASRLAWIEALATIEADGPLESAIAGVLDLGDANPEACLAALHAAQRIETEPLRAQALASAEFAELADPRVADAFVDTVKRLQDASVRADLLVTLLARSHAAPDFTVRWLTAARGLPSDERLASVLRAVPERQLTEPDIAAPFRALAGTLWSEADRAQLLGRLPIDAPR